MSLLENIFDRFGHHTTGNKCDLYIQVLSRSSISTITIGK